MHIHAAIAVIVAAVAVAGCATAAPPVATEVLVDVPPTAAAPARARECPPLPATVLAEAVRTTDISRDMTGALMVAELRKNRALNEAVSAYGRCRGR